MKKNPFKTELIFSRSVKTSSVCWATDEVSSAPQYQDSRLESSTIYPRTIHPANHSIFFYSIRRNSQTTLNYPYHMGASFEPPMRTHSETWTASRCHNLTLSVHQSVFSRWIYLSTQQRQRFLCCAGKFREVFAMFLSSLSLLSLWESSYFLLFCPAVLVVWGLQEAKISVNRKIIIFRNKNK